MSTFPRIPKNQVKSINTIQQAEHEDDADARRVLLVDTDGDPITEDNPLPVAPFSRYFNSLTLGSFGLVPMIEKCLENVTYDKVISSSSGDVETLNVYASDVLVHQVRITYANNGWTFECIESPTEGDRLLMENGDGFLLEDDSGDILLEG